MAAETNAGQTGAAQGIQRSLCSEIVTRSFVSIAHILCWQGMSNIVRRIHVGLQYMTEESIVWSKRSMFLSSKMVSSFVIAAVVWASFALSYFACSLAEKN